ncbi:MAG: glycine cleavage system protein H [Elusimicrobia bacterium RIFCSPLOWO2_01_FULL_64_13]|nr:MAG: glycine cleavage system protein H [Elusimicrobia bacterium RIFCSPHIGHO2_01_FULL_64_10]OGR96985.1 MAG: glycine cleavage system protein H [Elusimicrobia bacterium RIFCSPLOWO2_01_FULL_64_13]
MPDPKDLKFTESHEWISPDGTVGISDHAQKEITDVVFVELPAQGTELARGKEAATIESVKAAFPIYAPCSGKVSAVNGQVNADPAVVNRSPYGEGWLFKIAMSDPRERDGLMTHGQYQEFLLSEAKH